MRDTEKKAVDHLNAIAPGSYDDGELGPWHFEALEVQQGDWTLSFVNRAGSGALRFFFDRPCLSFTGEVDPQWLSKASEAIAAHERGPEASSSPDPGSPAALSETLFPPGGVIVGLSLGMPAEQVVEGLGQPSRDTPRTLTYRDAPIGSGVHATLTIRLNNKRMVTGVEGAFVVEELSFVNARAVALDGVIERYGGVLTGDSAEAELPEGQLLMVWLDLCEQMDQLSVGFRLRRR
ncbi:MAG: hypothetical protein KJO07_12970 [Deltaproteobacteria bacterium]|nr:hypothetical protein [Deltaproteobacteria bacterium]